MPRELAQQKAERDTATLYTHGLATPGLSVFVLEDEEAGEPIGNLALGERDVNGRKVMFVYDVVVDERHRGRGLGREAMLFAEEESRRRGIERVAVGGRIGSLLELGAGFHPDFTGRENVYLNGSIHGLSRRQVREAMDEIVAFAELEDFVDLPVRTYSSGMAMRLGFAVAAHIE